MTVTNSRHALTRPLSLASCLITLVACGGGGSGGQTTPLPPPPPANTAPTADAGADQAVAENDVITLAGAGADADGDTLSYTWSQLSGPAGAFSATDEASPDFTVPTISVGFEEDIVLQLTVSDGRGGTGTDDLTLTAASTDLAVFLADPSGTRENELFRYDPQTDSVITLNPALVAGGRVFSFAVSPEGDRVAYAAEQDVDNVRELYIALLDGSSVTKVNPAFGIGIGGSVAGYHWSPDGSQIVYAADIAGIREMYLADRDATSHRKLNADISAAGVTLDEAGWSADGRYVAYIVEDAATGRRLAVDISDTQTGTANSTRVSSVPAAGRVGKFAWSPDSTSIAYPADQDTDDVFELYAAALDGSGQQKLNGPLPAGSGVSQFAWSADGTRMAFTAGTNNFSEIELFSVASDGSDLSTVNATLETGDAIRHFAWSPIDNALAYIARHATDPDRGLYVANADGSNRLRVSVPPVAGGLVTDLRWSPDGNRLAYLGRIDSPTAVELYAVNRDGTAPVKLSAPFPVDDTLRIARAEDGAAWSPAGDRLAYFVISETGGSDDAFVVRADGSDRTEVTIGDGDGFSFPLWSADGSGVLYRFVPTGSVSQQLFFSQVEGSGRNTVPASSGPGGIAGRLAWVP